MTRPGERPSVVPTGSRIAVAMRAGLAAVPPSIRRRLRAQQRRYRLQRTPAGTVSFGRLRRLSPVSSVFGLDRGLPIDRYYIEQLLLASSVDVRGHVLEMTDATYTRRFGGSNVQRSDVLHYVAGNPHATIVADLAGDNEIPGGTFDCVICTQTLQFIYEPRAALHELHRILAPGGVLLLTAHGTSRIARRDGIDPWGEYWRFTAQSLARMFTETFPDAAIDVVVYGNVLIAVAALHGLAATELQAEELEHHDPNYEVVIGVRARKAVA